MKKALSLLLALIVVMTLSVGAMAVSHTGDDSMDVDADFVAGDVSDTGVIHSVHIEWNSIAKLTYTEGDTKYLWDAASQKYVVASSTESEWSGGAFKVTITNRSNADITATASYTDTANDGLTTEMEWAKQTVTCESAAKNIINYSGTGSPTTGELSGTVKVTEGSINANTAGVGRITITIN